MTRVVVIWAVRVLFPLGCVAFSFAFLANVSNMGRSERLFPYLLIAGLISAAIVVLFQETRSALGVRRLDLAEAMDQLDTDGLQGRGWFRSFFVAVSCLVYLLLINRLGLLPTVFIVYVICAAPLIAEPFQWQGWARAIAGAALASLILDLLFRVWLGLPLPPPFFS